MTTEAISESEAYRCIAIALLGQAVSDWRYLSLHGGWPHCAASREWNVLECREVDLHSLKDELDDWFADTGMQAFYDLLGIDWDWVLSRRDVRRSISSEHQRRKSVEWHRRNKFRLGRKCSNCGILINDLSKTGLCKPCFNRWRAASRKRRANGGTVDGV